MGLWSGGGTSARSFHVSDADASFSVFLMAKAHCHIVIFHALGASVHLSFLTFCTGISAGFANNNIQMKKSKSWDMHLHWLRDQELRNKLKIQWEKGKLNTSDYFTKHHAISHHRKQRPLYVRDAIQHIHLLFSKFRNVYR